MVATAAEVSAAGFYTRSGRIYDQGGQEVQVRGISNFGFNGTSLVPQYLWAMGWKEQIAQIKSLGFNAIRVPFVPDTLYNQTPVEQLSYVHPGLNPEFIGKTPLQALDLWMAEAERQGMYVLLDFHSVSMQRQYPTWFVDYPADYGLIYNRQPYSKDDWIRDLKSVALRYVTHDHFLGIDIYNEPNGVVRWSTGDLNASNPKNFWKDAAESAASAVLAVNPQLLIFVQGINGNYDGREQSNIPMNWAEDFQPQAYQPLAIPADKLVLSPHTYGPDVYVKSSFGAANFPGNLAADWETLFGQFAGTHAVVIGEWGGKYGSGTGGLQDVLWQNALVDYMISKNMRNSFYWSYSPNSGDTGGILDDNLNVREDKMALLRKLWGAAPAGVAPPAVDAPLPLAPAVATPAAADVQPYIADFAPLSGPVGTVVTINGNGFTGLNEAWVGTAKGVAVQVIDDTRVQVTIPANGTTGAIGIFNAVHAGFTAQSFTVTAAATTTATSSAASTSAGAPTSTSSTGGAGATTTSALGALATLLGGRLWRLRRR
jgi:aryl-phospho-beta-D-glucosidase BglC (GH1 family)